MKTKTEMEIIKDLTSESFWGNILSNALMVLCTGIIFKLFWGFISFIKWIVFDYSDIKKDIRQGKTEITEIKTALIKIEKKLGIYDYDE